MNFQVVAQKEEEPKPFRRFCPLSKIEVCYGEDCMWYEKKSGKCSILLIGEFALFMLSTP
jgi:hypothetical protein